MRSINTTLDQAILSMLVLKSPKAELLVLSLYFFGNISTKAASCDCL